MKLERTSAVSSTAQRRCPSRQQESISPKEIMQISSEGESTGESKKRIKLGRPKGKLASKRGRWKTGLK